MKKQHLFTLDVDLVKKLHKEVARGHRSQFVEKAIRKALSGKIDFDLWDVEVKDLMKILRARANIMEDEVLHAILHKRLEEME
jgi:hypothetical protein